jgi:hypothetical protein
VIGFIQSPGVIVTGAVFINHQGHPKSLRHLIGHLLGVSGYKDPGSLMDQQPTQQ